MSTSFNFQDKYKDFVCNLNVNLPLVAKEVPHV